MLDAVTSQRVWNALDRRLGTLELVVGARDETRRSAARERAVDAETMYSTSPSLLCTRI